MMPEIKMELNKWQTPNFATIKAATGRRQDGMKEMPSIPVADLPEDAFHDLVKAWLVELYEKAGRSPNWRFD